MIIKKYGIELQLLTKKDIELVRQERNKDFIRSKMINQSIINSKQQQKWFKTINNSNNFYFIIVHENKKIGLIHGKNIDWKKRR